MNTITLLWVVLLMQVSAVKCENSDKKEIPPNLLRKFCTDFNDLPSSGSMGNIIQDFNQIREQLAADGVLPQSPRDYGPYKKACDEIDSPVKYEKPECLYFDFWKTTMDNRDFQMRDTDCRRIYVDLWLLHPLYSRCLKLINKDASSIHAKHDMAKALYDGENANCVTDDIFHYRRNTLSNEIKKHCKHNEHKDVKYDVFCESLPGFERMAEVYKSVYRLKRYPDWRAFLLNFVMLKQNNPKEFEDIYPTTDDELYQLLEANAEDIFKFFVSGRVDRLKELMSYMPSLEAIKSGCRTLQVFIVNLEKLKCMFWTAMIQIKAHLKAEEPPASGHISKILNTNVDYKKLIELKGMERILQVVQDSQNAQHQLANWLREEFANISHSRFKSLRQYYEDVEVYNREKSYADILFIRTRLDGYSDRIKSLSVELGGNVGKLIDYSTEAVALEITEDAATLAVSGALMSNPIGAVLGSTSILDFKDRVAKLASSMSDIALLEQIKRAFTALMTKTIDISDRLKKNDGFLKIVGGVIAKAGNQAPTQNFETQKQIFLDKYAEYDPEVKKPELTSMSAAWELLIESCCELILEKETALAQVTVTRVKDSGICPDSKILAQEMSETYAEVYDFQFDLIETMASYMRALNSMNAASTLTASFEEFADQRRYQGVSETVTITSYISFITFKINMWQMSEEYCDILEYKEGGVRPSECKGINTTLSSLLSHPPRTCRDSRTHFRNVPTTNNSPTDQAFLNITKLYAGQPVAFKIPNGQWLVDNTWISSEDNQAKIMVKSFVVYLPTESLTERLVRVEVKTTGENKLSPSSDVNYVIIPHAQFISEYLEGAEVQCVKESDAMNNPYGAELPKICPMTVEENSCNELLQSTRLFPSVYSEWQVSIHGYESQRAPDPASPLYVKAAVKLCIFSQSRRDKGTRKPAKKKGNKGRAGDEPTTCPDGEYYSIAEGECLPCPEGSKSVLNGYYCEKINTEN